MRNPISFGLLERPRLIAYVIRAGGYEALGSRLGIPSTAILAAELGDPIFPAWADKLREAVDAWDRSSSR